MKRYLTLLLVALVAVAVSAQSNVKWRTTVKMTTATEGVLSVKAIVPEGWHLYGTKLPKGGPKATVLDFAESKGLKFTSQFVPSVAPTEKLDPVFELKLNWWTGTVVFTRKFKLTGPKDKAQVKGKITYMLCDDEACRPPKTDSVLLSL